MPSAGSPNLISRAAALAMITCRKNLNLLLPSLSRFPVARASQGLKSSKFAPEGLEMCHLKPLRNQLPTAKPIPVVARADCPGGKISFQFSAIVGIKPLGYVTPDSREQTRANAMPRAPRARRRRILFLGEWARYRTECLSRFSIRYGKPTSTNALRLGHRF